MREQASKPPAYEGGVKATALQGGTAWTKKRAAETAARRKIDLPVEVYSAQRMNPGMAERQLSLDGRARALMPKRPLSWQTISAA